MNSLDANIRDNKSKGQLNSIKKNGNVPAIIYGGKDENHMFALSGGLLMPQKELQVAQHAITNQGKKL